LPTAILHCTGLRFPCLRARRLQNLLGAELFLSHGGSNCTFIGEVRAIVVAQTNLGRNKTAQPEVL
jgi:hypothetical protein